MEVVAEATEVRVKIMGVLSDGKMAKVVRYQVSMCLSSKTCGF